MPQAENRKIRIFIGDLLRRFNRCFWTEKLVIFYVCYMIYTQSLIDSGEYMSE